MAADDEIRSPAEGPAQGAGRRVLVVGGGFAGLEAAKRLSGSGAEVVLVDRRNHHLFQPLLYQVATAALSAVDIARPIRAILRKRRDVTVLLGEVVRVVPDERRVVLADGGLLPYDHLILAAGLVSSYFGRDAWRRHAPGLKGLSDALEVRRRILLAFEAAELEADPAARRPWQTFVVVGAGPTGVELAGALREIATQTMVRDFRRTDPRETRVVLVEARERVLPTFPERLSRWAERMLAERGVELRLATRVDELDERGVLLGRERLEARTVLWAAGVRAAPVAETLGVSCTRDGRILVGPDLRLPEHPEIQVVGDLAALQDERGAWIPAMAPAAIQQGRHAAENVRRALRGEPSRPFRYVDRGVLATIGRAEAVARVGRLSLRGFSAWLVWLCVHLAWLIGFRNRLVVLIDWAWAYLTFQRNARVVDDLEVPHRVPREEPSAADGQAARAPGERARAR